MPSVYDLKPCFQALLRPLMQRLVGAGFTPNIITLLALAGSLLTGAALSQAGKHPALLLLLPVWLFMRMALNAIDGMMAREFSMATPLGAVLNELGDALADLGLYLPLAFVNSSSLWPVVAFAIGAVLTEFCGVLGRAIGASRRYEGPMGKSDRAFVVGVLGIVTFAFPVLLQWWWWIFSLTALLTLLTCRNRLVNALREITA